MKIKGRGMFCQRVAVVAACALWCLSARALPVAAQEERVRPAGEVVVVLSEQLLSSIVEAIAAQPVPPTYRLSRGSSSGGGCADVVALLPESSGTRTAVRFAEGRITAPVAFRGAYDAPLVGCFNFEGWADTAIDLEFDSARQTLNARLRVREVNLKNVPSFAGNGLAGLVQDAIDERVNPIEILRAEQLGARLPAARGSLRLRAKEVRHELAGKELRLRIVYEIVSSGQ